MVDWYRITSVGKISSPTILLHPHRIQRNLERMITMTGGAEATQLRRGICDTRVVAATRLHAYDGHQRDAYEQERATVAERTFALLA